MGRACVVSSAGIGIFILVAAVAGAEMPDAEVNGVTGNIESVDAPFSNGYKIRHIVDPGQGGNRTAETLSAGAGSSPRIAVDSSGDSWVVWWNDSAGTVYYRQHDLSGSTWSVQKAISTPSEDSRYPEIIHDGAAAWIAFQVDTSALTSIAVQNIIDSADPVTARMIVATSTALGDLDLQIHAEAGALWITWVDEDEEVGWVEYDATSETWSATYYESYSGSDVDTARATVRDIVLGL